MKALTESRFLRLFVFGALYVAQGIPWGFVAGGFQRILGQQGVSNEGVGDVMFYVYLPWSLKILFGVFIDRFPSARFGRRRPHIVAAEVVMGATMLMLLLFDPRAHLRIFIAIVIVHNICTAFQDVAVDALAVDILPADERGRANGIMWAAKVSASAIGNGGGIYLSKHFGWPPIFVAMALLVWTIMLLPIFIRERPAPERSESTRERLNFVELKRTVTLAEPLLGIVIAFLTPIGYALINSFTVRMYSIDLKLNEEQLGLLNGPVYLAAGMSGALAGGAVADRLGVRKTIGGFMILIATMLALFGAVPQLWPSFRFLVAWQAVFQFSVSAFGAASLKFFMTLCNPAVGATHFAIYTSTTNLCYALTAKTGGWMADHWGYTSTYYVAGLIQLITIGLLFFCDPKRAEDRFRARPQTTPPAVESAPRPAG